VKTILAIVFVLVTAVPAVAEWGLYANRDGKGFVLEKTFAFLNDCDAAARAAWRAAQQQGAFGCSEYSATSFANRNASQSSPRTSGQEPFGEKFQQAQQEQRERKAQQEAEWRADQRARDAAREQGREQGRQLYNCIRGRGIC
jgi:hypothetical protein